MKYKCIVKIREGRKRNNKYNEQKTAIRKVDIHPTISVIVLNVNDLNTPIKSWRLKV